jgi:hypothetical protein
MEYAFMNTKLNISKNRQNYNELRKKFIYLAYDLSSEFENQHLDEKIGLFKTFSQVKKIAQPAAKECIKILISHGIYDIDIEQFLSDYDSDDKELRHKYGDLYYIDIFKYQRPKGLNFNIVLDGMSLTIFEYVYRMQFYLIEIINNRLDACVYDVPNYENAKRALGIFNNLELGDFDYYKKINLLGEIINLNPYRSKYYEYIIDNYGDENLEIENIANYFDINLDKYKVSYIYEIYHDIKLENEEDTIEALKQIQNKIEFIGIKEHTVIGELKRILEEFNLQSRTVDDIVFETKEEANLARGEKIKLDFMFDEFYKFNEDQLIDLKQVISSDKFISNIVPKYISKIDTRLSEIDIEKRTVNGVLFESREEANLVIQEKEKLDFMFKNFELLGENELIELKRKIEESDFKTSVLSNYKAKLNNEILKKQEEKSIRQMYAAADLDSVENIKVLLEELSNNYQTDIAIKYKDELSKRLNKIQLNNILEKTKLNKVVNLFKKNK